jgi:hypothetical protein
MKIWFPQIANRGFEVQWTTNPADRSSWQALTFRGIAPFSGVDLIRRRTQTSTCCTRERLTDFTACEFLSRKIK